MRNVVVLGCGFAGYHAARRLEKELRGRRRVQLSVITNQDQFVFTPLLAGVASGDLAPDHVTTPVNEAFDTQTRIVVDEVEHVDFQRRQLVGVDHQLPFDYLLIATGGMPNPEAFEGADTVLGPNNLSDAVDVRERVAQLRVRDEFPLHFTIIGGSTTGVEWAAELATALALDWDLASQHAGVTIDLFEAGPRLLPDHSEQMAALAESILDDLDINVHVHRSVRSADRHKIVFRDGEELDVSQVFHCAGRTGIDLWKDTTLALDEMGRIVVDDTLAIADLPGIFVAGDAATPLADIPSSSNPQIALQQGQWAARNLLADMSGRTKKPFEFEDRGDFITLGRNHAALKLGGIVLEGKAAWLAYRLYYTAMMPRPIQKRGLLMDWIAGRIAANDQ